MIKLFITFAYQNSINRYHIISFSRIKDISVYVNYSIYALYKQTLNHVREEIE